MTEKEFDQKVEDMAARFERGIEASAAKLEKGVTHKYGESRLFRFTIRRNFHSCRNWTADRMEKPCGKRT